MTSREISKMQLQNHEMHFFERSRSIASVDALVQNSLTKLDLLDMFSVSSESLCCHLIIPSSKGRLQGNDAQTWQAVSVFFKNRSLESNLLILHNVTQRLHGKQHPCTTAASTDEEREIPSYRSLASERVRQRLEGGGREART